MCATHSRPAYSGTYRSDHDRNSRQPPPVQAAHSAPYPFYPPPYLHYPPYDPYAAYHYSASCYPTMPPCTSHGITSESTSWSLFSIILFTLFVIVSIGILCYRNISHDTRRRIAAWFTLPSTAQVNLCLNITLHLFIYYVTVAGADNNITTIERYLCQISQIMIYYDTCERMFANNPHILYVYINTACQIFCKFILILKIENVIIWIFFFFFWIFVLLLQDEDISDKF